MNRYSAVLGLVVCVSGVILLAQSDTPNSSGCSSKLVARCDTTRSEKPIASHDNVVLLEVEFSSSGKARSVKVLSGPCRFHRAAIEAVKKRNSGGVQGTFEVWVTFSHKDGSIDYIGEVYTAASAGCTILPVEIAASENGMKAHLIKRIEPVYPPKAKARHIEGTVRLGLIVDEHGKVIFARKFSGPVMLGPAAIAAVKEWEFHPFLLRGIPKRCQTTVDVNFALP